MNDKFLSNRTAKRLVLGGTIGIVIGVIAILVILLPLYNNVGNCPVDNTNCSTNFISEQVGINIALGCIYISLATIVAAIAITVAIHFKSKQ